MDRLAGGEANCCCVVSPDPMGWDPQHGRSQAPPQPIAGSLLWVSPPRAGGWPRHTPGRVCPTSAALLANLQPTGQSGFGSGQTCRQLPPHLGEHFSVRADRGCP